MLRIHGQTGRLLLVIALVVMSVSLIATTPVSAAKPSPPPSTQLEVIVRAELPTGHSGIAQAMVMASDQTGMPVAKSRTDGNGVCVFDLAPGTYILDANAPGYYNTKALVELTAGGPTKVVEMVLQEEPVASPYRMLSLFITDSPLKGIGIPAALVTAYGPDGTLQVRGLTDDMGYYKPLLLPGQYKVIVSAYGYYPAALSVDVTQVPVTDFTVVLQPLTPQALNLLVTNPVTNGGIAGAAVTVLDTSNTPRAKGLTDNMGYYQPQLLPGLYKVIVNAPKYQQTTLVVEVLDGATTNVTVMLYPSIYRPLNVLVERAGVDTGLPGVSVKVLNQDNTMLEQGLTDGRGYYKPMIPIGIYKVVVTAPGYKTVIAEVKVSEAPLTELTVVMYPVKR